jgi:uncharacterized protein
MNCPKCNKVLVKAERQGIKLDYCPYCRGIWLKRGELDKILEIAGIPRDQMTYNPYNTMEG